MLVGEVKSSERNIVGEYDIQSFPTLLVISPEHGHVKFEGKLNHDNLKSFMNKYALPSEKKVPGEPSTPKEPKKKAKTGKVKETIKA
jgi:protein disulfide-isomerase A6